MSKRRSKTDYSLEQSILLGAQTTRTHPEFKTLAMLGPSYMETFIMLDKMDEILKEQNPIEKLKLLIKYLGMCEFLTVCTELTKLSMIIGDTSQHYSFKKLKDLIEHDDTE